MVTGVGDPCNKVTAAAVPTIRPSLPAWGQLVVGGGHPKCVIFPGIVIVRAIPWIPDS